MRPPRTAGKPKFSPSPEISRRYCRPRRRAIFCLRSARILRQLPVDRVVLVEEVPPPRAESAELAAEHGLADVAVVVALAVEALLAAVIDARDAQRGGVERQDVQQQLAVQAGSPAQKRALWPPLRTWSWSSNRVTTLLRNQMCDSLLHQQRVAEQVEVLVAGRGSP